MGAARDFAVQLYGGPAIVRRSVVSVGTGVTEVVKGDPDRLRLVIVHHGTADVFLTPGRGAALSAGYRVAPGDTLQWRVDLDGEELADRFEAISGAAAQSLFVSEVIRLREGT